MNMHANLTTNPILDWNTYLESAAEAVSEGIVLLKNEHNVLPLPQNTELAVFGRMQLHYYKSGTGSGGLVNVAHVTDLLEGLATEGIHFQSELLSAYRQWDAEHPITRANGFGAEPWSQAEMPLPDSLAEQAARTCQTALCIIGRTAGEDQDNFDDGGSYRLTCEETAMLHTVRAHFPNMIVLLNVANIIDMTDIEAAQPDAILYAWQGGMTGGTGTARVLTGRVNPSGKLPDTIAYQLSDYPSDPYFGNPERNFYTEDIYVGYRYFETVAQDRVRYPFGFGLSYTTFTLERKSAALHEGIVTITVTVTNTGDRAGKEVVQVYCEAPQGALGKPARVLCAFAKTQLLQPNSSEDITLEIPLDTVASYDDSGASGYRFWKVLEAGDYRFYVGTDVRSATLYLTENVFETMPRILCHSAMAPVLPFDRMKPTATEAGFSMAYEPVPLMEYDEAERCAAGRPAEIPYTGDRGIRLADVRDANASMRDFIAQMDENALCCIVRGEGMGVPKVTPGTAAAMGGITEQLSALGIPCACCDDGPSGLRLDSGAKAFSLPIGTLLASSFNPTLIEKLFRATGLEMTANQIDVLLGPGMNIHRHPRNGRNFEYFSEDPFLTGKMAAAVIRGLQSSGVTGTLKHFCGNNQETNRYGCDNCISERALREIYLRGFEIALAECGADAIMTTYGSVNGQWTAGSYDLNTVILREEWGFSGITMTDWWANINRRGEAPDPTNYAAMITAQNDIYMVCSDTTTEQGNLHTALRDGTLTIGELQRSAANLCSFLMRTNAMRRLTGNAITAEIVGRPADSQETGMPIPCYDVTTEFTVPLDTLCTVPGKRNAMILHLAKPGVYECSVTAATDENAGISLHALGSHAASFTFRPCVTPITQKKQIRLFSQYATIQLYMTGAPLQRLAIMFRLVADAPAP